MSAQVLLETFKILSVEWGKGISVLLREEVGDEHPVRQPLWPRQVLSDFSLIKSQDLYEGHGSCERSFEAMQQSTCPGGCRHKSKQGGRQGPDNSRHLSPLRVLPAGPVALVEGSSQQTKLLSKKRVETPLRMRT